MSNQKSLVKKKVKLFNFLEQQRYEKLKRYINIYFKKINSTLFLGREKSLRFKKNKRKTTTDKVFCCKKYNFFIFIDCIFIFLYYYILNKGKKIFFLVYSSTCICGKNKCPSFARFLQHWTH